jgi:hypothetical protein
MLSKVLYTMVSSEKFLTQWYAEQSSLHDGKLRKILYTISAKFPTQWHNSKLRKVPFTLVSSAKFSSNWLAQESFLQWEA